MTKNKQEVEVEKTNLILTNCGNGFPVQTGDIVACHDNGSLYQLTSINGNIITHQYQEEYITAEAIQAGDIVDLSNYEYDNLPSIKVSIENHE